MPVGILHLIHSDNHGRLLIQLFKILLLLISSTPYVQFFCILFCYNDIRFIVKVLYLFKVFDIRYHKTLMALD